MRKKIIALGFFDGVHLGHQALLKSCNSLAQQYQLQPAAVTFSQYPGTGEIPPLINTTEDRVALLKQFGMEEITVYPFTDGIRTMPWEEFFEELLSNGGSGFVCGHDYRFGYRGEGTAEKLQEICQKRGIPCVIVPEQRKDGLRIASTHIRNLLQQGDMAEAADFLGHPHRLSGTVQSGQQLGRTIGIPTANMLLPEGVVCPRLGVYATKATVDAKTYLAVTNIGTRPTVGGRSVTVETWILDFAGDIYGKTLLLEIYAFLRPEQNFASLEVLREEIWKNAQQTREILEKT